MKRHYGAVVPVMRYGALGGVQSTPRVMRGVPAARPTNYDVPLSRRDLAGLSDQGLARTLGSLGGCTLGTEEIEMPEECMRAGEVLIAPGVCGPDPRKPIDPYAVSPQTVRVPINTTRAPAASAAGAMGGKMSPQLLILGALAVGAIYYFGRK